MIHKASYKFRLGFIRVAAVKYFFFLSYEAILIRNVCI